MATKQELDLFAPRPVPSAAPDPRLEIGHARAGFEHWLSAMAWQRSVDRKLAPLGLTHTQFWLLQNAEWLQDRYSDAVGQYEIADAARIDSSTASGIARRLESKGLIDRAPAFGLRTTYRVLVTETGSDLLERARPLVTCVAAERPVGQRCPECADVPESTSGSTARISR